MNNYNPATLKSSSLYKVFIGLKKWLLVLCLSCFCACAPYNYPEFLIKSKFEEATKKHLSGDYKNALILYKELLHTHPSSHLKENILLNLADVYFALNDT
ncbi:MAG: hypothetical protein ACK4NF_05835, partial [Planctomycetota bacterium]